MFMCFPTLILVDKIQDLLTPLSRVEERIGLKIPIEATDIHHSYSSWMDVTARVRFNLRAEHFDSFFADLTTVCAGFSEGLEENYSPFPLDSDNWWTPNQAKIFSGAKCHTEDWKRFSILVDESNPEEYIIFLSTN